MNTLTRNERARSGVVDTREAGPRCLFGNAVVLKHQLHIGFLIFVFYFTSKILLYYQHLLVKMEQCSKKDLDREQVQISQK